MFMLWFWGAGNKMSFNFSRQGPSCGTPQIYHQGRFKLYFEPEPFVLFTGTAANACL